ncbi:MAG: SOS response-associated peptidase [Acidobacteriota bacterium]|nr:SOS response-associated peptidase [Acidobacteriota bacterium]
MCGRFTSTSTVTDLAEVFGVEEVRAEPLEPRYNVAPSLPVYAVALRRPDGGSGQAAHRALGTFKWGLVPSWATDPAVGNRMINARAEGITTKPAYRRAVAGRRCLIPADAFYEWQRRVGSDGRPAGRLPHAVRRRDGRPMALAGVWESWRDPADPAAPPMRTCAIVTTAANRLLAPIHDRMPVIVEEPDWQPWLDPATDMGLVETLMRPAADDLLEVYPVSTRVNHVANDGPELLEPLGERPC